MILRFGLESYLFVCLLACLFVCLALGWLVALFIDVRLLVLIGLLVLLKLLVSFLACLFLCFFLEALTVVGSYPLWGAFRAFLLGLQGDEGFVCVCVCLFAC